MRTGPSGERVTGAFVVFGSLCLASLPPQMWAAKIKPQPARKLTPAAKADLLLARFTFGPTTADRQAVQRQGIEGWFDRQLQPQNIDDSALERRLDAYPALRMTQADRLQRYPDPATLRQLARTGVLPTDPELHAIVADQVEIYEARRANKTAQATPGAPVVRQVGSSGEEQPVVVPGKFGQAPAPQKNLEQSTEPMPRAQVETILALQPTERYRQLLSLPVEDLIAFRKAARGPLAARVTDGMSPLQRETLLALGGTNRMINAETQGSRLLRDIYSQRELEAVMTDFWLNHFNVFSGKSGQEPSLLLEYEETVRARALGRFEDLLAATAQSPAMLLYLDNAQSTGPDSKAAQRSQRKAKNNTGLNENYARELMELHTLGVNGGYTQQDVTEVAKVFTGWTLERPNSGGNYTFTPNRHEPGLKTVLGKSIAEGGEQEGLQVLHMLATSPATAHFISTELAQRFVSDTPPAAMVDRMAATFLKSGGDIRQVLRTMVHSPEFFTAATVDAKLKTPLEYVTSAVRASGADVTDPLPLVQSLQQLGMPLYGCQPPTGYKWDETTWLSSSALVNRMNFALSLSTNRISGTMIDWTPVLQGTMATLRPTSLDFANDAEASRKELLLEASLLPVPASAQTRAAVLSQGTDGTASQAAKQFAATSTTRPLTDAEMEAQQQDRLDAMMAGKAKGIKGAAQPQRGLGMVPIKAGPPPADKQAAAIAGLLLGSPEFQRR
ncbi:MAG: DUF1800 domain-containing protein [Janthinobacterium lividum]